MNRATLKKLLLVVTMADCFYLGFNIASNGSRALYYIGLTIATAAALTIMNDLDKKA